MQSTSQSNLSEREISEDWAKITIQFWRKNLSRMKIDQNPSRGCYQSFKFKVIAGSSVNVDRIEFAFNYYGKFLEIIKKKQQMSFNKGMALTEIDARFLMMGYDFDFGGILWFSSSPS